MDTDNLKTERKAQEGSPGEWLSEFALSGGEMRLVEQLYTEKLLTEEQLREALEEKKQNPELQVVQILLKKHYLNTQDYVRFLTQSDFEEAGIEPTEEPESASLELTSPQEKEEVARESPPKVRKAKKFGNYALVKKLGQGGMSIVFKAVELESKRKVALKILTSGKVASESEKRRFHKEIQAMSRLRHENIVSIYDVGEVHGITYYTMDYIKGQSLKELGGKLPFREVAAIMQKVCMGVQHAHDATTIHRDIKPENILVDENNHPYISDFGLAKDLSEYSSLTGSGACLGTPLYMSPEQAKGESKCATYASDIYSLGATFYYLLTGKPPFVRGNFVHLIHAIVKESPKPPSSLNRKLPPEADWIVLCAMHKNPAKHYPSAKAISDDIAAYLEDRSLITAKKPKSLAAWLEKHAAWVVGMALLVLAILVLRVFSKSSKKDTVTQTKPSSEDTRPTAGPKTVPTPGKEPKVDAATARLFEMFSRQFKDLIRQGKAEEAYNHCHGAMQREELSSMRERIFEMKLEAGAIQASWEIMKKGLVQEKTPVWYKNQQWRVTEVHFDTLVLQRHNTKISVPLHTVEVRNPPKLGNHGKFWAGLGLAYYYQEKWDIARKYFLLAKEGHAEVDGYLKAIEERESKAEENETDKTPIDSSRNRRSYFQDKFGKDLHDMDRDGDGNISRQEWKGRQIIFRLLDRNRDGFLSQEDRD